jgi:hypothetical protein
LVDVLVPAGTQKRDAGFVRIHRTTRLPEPFGVAGEVRFAFPPPAVADAARGLTDIGNVRAVVAGAVQRGSARSGRSGTSLTTDRGEDRRCCGARWRRWLTGLALLPKPTCTR